MSQFTLKLIDSSTGLMQCEVCGRQKYVDVKPDSKQGFCRIAQECPDCHGELKLEEKKGRQ